MRKINIQNDKDVAREARRYARQRIDEALQAAVEAMPRGGVYGHIQTPAEQREIARLNRIEKRLQARGNARQKRWDKLRERTVREMQQVRLRALDGVFSKGEDPLKAAQRFARACAQHAARGTEQHRKLREE
jgi:molecular chaperone GrpE (heat shock protein)